MKKNQSGQSLVSVIIAGGVGAIVLGFLTDTMIQQGLGQKFLTQKLEINDLTNNLITTFSKADNCSCQFADNAATNPNHANFATNLKFDTTLPIDQRKISVKKLYTGCKSATFTPPILVEDNEFVPNSSSNLKVDTVELVNLEQVGGPNEWQGQWQISFQTGSGKVIRSVRPITVTQKVTINTSSPNSATAAVISACTGISTGSGTENYLAKWTDTLGVLQNSAVFESSGNVGIGTTTPARNLHIRSSFDTAARIDSPAGFQNFVEFTKGGAQAGFIGMAMNTGLFTGINNGDMAVRSQNTPLHLGAQATPGITILPNNNVGIGTTSPADELHIREQAGSTDAELRLEYSGTGGGTARQYSIAASFDGNFHITDKNVNIQRFTVGSSGNVGIGTTNPRTALDIPNGTISGWFPGTNPTTGQVCYNGASGKIDACVSLRKFKKNIRPLDIGINEILRLEPVSYEMKADGTKEIGFIAEHATTIDERFGQKSTEGKVIGVRYSQMVALLTKGIQELYNSNVVANDEVASLKEAETLNKSNINRLIIENEKLKEENTFNTKALLELKAYLCSKDKEAPICK